MGVGLSEHVVGDHGYVAYKGVCDEVAVNNLGICIRDTNIRTLYRHIADGGFQSIAKVAGPRPRPQPDIERGRVK